MAFVCEICGGTNVIKTGDAFACEACGTKYSVEDVRKMMTGGAAPTPAPAPIAATSAPTSAPMPTVDEKTYMERSLVNARRAKDKEDWEEMEKYYNMVEERDPECLEAIVYSAYGKAMQTLFQDDFFKRQQVFNVLKNCIGMIWEKMDSTSADTLNFVLRFSNDLYKLFNAQFVYKVTRNGYGTIVSSEQSKTEELFDEIKGKFISVVELFTRSCVRAEKKEEVASYCELAMRYLGKQDKRYKYFDETLRTVDEEYNERKKKEEEAENRKLNRLIQEEREREEREAAERRARMAFENRKENVQTSTWILILVIAAFVAVLISLVQDAMHMDAEAVAPSVIVSFAGGLLSFYVLIPLFIFALILKKSKSNCKLIKVAKIFAIISAVTSFLAAWYAGIMVIVAVVFLFKLAKIRDWDSFWAAEKNNYLPKETPAPEEGQEPGEISMDN